MPIVKFVPRTIIIESDTKINYIESMETNEFYKNLVEVLSFYNVPFHATTNNTIYVPLTIVLNKELSWNFTKKSK